MKKKVLSIIVIVFFSLLIFIQCTNNELLDREYPTVETLEVNNFTKDGVTFNANLSNSNNLTILEYGFLWDTNNYPKLYTAEKAIISNNIKSGHFSANITTTLVNGKEYYVRSYVKTEKHLIYGNLQKFLSFGSGAATITKLEPNTGVWGDTIKIIGKEFSYINKSNIVKFKDVTAKVIKSNDSVITCIVPENLVNDQVTVNLTIANREAKSPSKFQIKSPIINSISPLTASFGDEITITGDHFGIKPEYNKVYFGNELAFVTYSDKNTIKVKVPNHIESGSERIKIKSKSSFVESQNEFKLRKPEIVKISTEVNTNEIVTIETKYIHPIKEKNKVLFEGNEAEIISANINSISVKVPIGPYPKRTAKVNIEVLDISSENSAPINILDKWVLISNNSLFYNHDIGSAPDYSGFPSDAVVASNNAYIIARYSIYNHGTDFHLWKFDKVNKIWEVEKLPNEIKNSYSILKTMTDGKNIYVISSGKDSFWKYNTITKTWSKKNNFNFDISRNMISLSINGKIYVGLGIIPYSKYSNTFYEYDPLIDSWKTLKVLPSSGRGKAASFSINGIGYIIGGVKSNKSNDCWSYNPSNDSWNQIADFPYDIHSASGFELNGYGYITGGVINGKASNKTWRYDPQQNNWILIESFSIGRKQHYSFSLNGKGYVGGGELYKHGIGTDLFEFIPD